MRLESGLDSSGMNDSLGGKLAVRRTPLSESVSDGDDEIALADSRGRTSEEFRNAASAGARNRHSSGCRTSLVEPASARRELHASATLLAPLKISQHALVALDALAAKLGVGVGVLRHTVLEAGAPRALDTRHARVGCRLVSLCGFAAYAGVILQAGSTGSRGVACTLPLETRPPLECGAPRRRGRATGPSAGCARLCVCVAA